MSSRAVLQDRTIYEAKCFGVKLTCKKERFADSSRSQLFESDNFLSMTWREWKISGKVFGLGCKACGWKIEASPECNFIAGVETLSSAEFTEVIHSLECPSCAEKKLSIEPISK